MDVSITFTNCSIFRSIYKLSSMKMLAKLRNNYTNVSNSYIQENSRNMEISFYLNSYCRNKVCTMFLNRR